LTRARERKQKAASGSQDLPHELQHVVLAVSGTDGADLIAYALP